MASENAVPDTPCCSPLILIVEDIPFQVRTLTAILSELDCRIAIAPSGEQALNEVRKHPPDLILLDLILPDMDGLVVLRTLQEQEAFHDLPVIILTAKGKPENIVAGLEAGAVDYIPKPFHPAELKARVKTHLRCRKMWNNQKALITELQEALGAVQQLSGLIPICAHCKKVRNDTGYWQQVEEYIAKHTAALFTHGLCPECVPIFFPEAAQAGVAIGPLHHPESGTATEHRSRILVVDDSPMNMQLLLQLLRPDHDLLVATHGQVALDLARTEQPDLILLDVLMPDMDGREVCRALKADPRTDQIPVIFITGNGREIDEIEGFRLGAVDYIAKPFSLPLVRARVRTHLELKHCRDKLMHQLMRDNLTGLRNRKGFQDFLELIWRQAVRHRTPLALILFNVDCLKEFNHRYGRPAGDECLQKIATTLKSMKRRSTDLIARYSGQEFVCLLPGTDLDGAFLIAEMVRAGVEGLAIPHPGLTPPVVTLSAGVASCEPTIESNPSSLLEQASQALYQARERGSSKVRVP